MDDRREHHHCHATGCKLIVPPEWFLCRHHWVQLPQKLKDLIWKHYRPGQCDDMKPSIEYCLAAIACIVWTAMHEDVRPEVILYIKLLLQEIEDFTNEKS